MWGAKSRPGQCQYERDRGGASFAERSQGMYDKLAVSIR